MLKIKLYPDNPIRDGNKYAGNYQLDKKTGEVKGCPARAPAVMAVLHAVKIRAVEKGHAAVCNHAEAITIEEVQKIMEWSEKTCPDNLLTLPVEDLEILMFRAEHALMRAFISSAFTLWTRFVTDSQFLLRVTYSEFQKR